MDTITTGAEQSAPSFVLRDLKSTDVWQLVRILSKLGVKDFAKSIDPQVAKAAAWKPPTMINKEGEEVPLPREKWTERQIDAELQKEMADDELTWSVLGLLMEKIGDCETDVNKLLASGTGMTVPDIQEMDANDYLELLSAYISREGFRDFFMHAWKLIKGASKPKRPYGETIASLVR